MSSLKLTQAHRVVGSAMNFNLPADELRVVCRRSRTASIHHLLANLLIGLGKQKALAGVIGDSNAGGGEGLYQIVFETGRSVRSVQIRTRAALGQDDQLAGGFYAGEFIFVVMRTGR